MLVLDNFDALFSSGERAGTYRVGYEQYGELLQRVGEVAHQSCLLLTSREKSAEVAALAGEFLPVRSLQLSGLNNNEARRILAAKGIYGSVNDEERLIESYRGNPLKLKIAATRILDLFDGSIAEFLEENTIVFNGVRNLLDRQFERLSPLEAEVMYWTCIYREPIQIGDLIDDIVPTVSKANLLETLESLSWRSLIEKGRDVNTTFTQQPLVREYMTDRLVAGVCEEVKLGKINLLNKYVLIGEHREVVRSPRPYENMNIIGITSLNSPQKATLKTLGALELVSNYERRSPTSLRSRGSETRDLRLKIASDR